CANAKCNVGRQLVIDDGGQFFQWLKDSCGLSLHVIGEEVCALQPHQLSAAEKRKCLQRSDGRADGTSSLFHVVGRAVNCLESKLPRFCWRKFLRELGCFAFQRRLIRTDDGVNVCGSCFQFRHRATISTECRFTQSRPQTHAYPESRRRRGISLRVEPHISFV